MYIQKNNTWWAVLKHKTRTCLLFVTKVQLYHLKCYKLRVPCIHHLSIIFILKTLFQAISAKTKLLHIWAAKTEDSHYVSSCKVMSQNRLQNINLSFWHTLSCVYFVRIEVKGQSLLFSCRSCNARTASFKSNAS